MSSGPGELPSGSASPASGGRPAAGDPPPRATRATPGDALRALRESEARYHGFFEESFDGMFITTPAGRFLDVNRKLVAILGYDRKEEVLALDLPHDVYADPSDRARILAAVDAEGSGEFDVVVKRRGGERRVAHFAVTAERDETGTTRTYRCVARDVTDERRAEEERRRLEEQLRQSQKLEAVARLAGGVAHDFNNILAVINGCADLALDAIPASDPAREDLVEIRDAGQRAAALTRQLLAFARKQVLEPVVLNLNDVVAETEKLLRRLVGEDVVLHTRLASELGNTLADRSEMEQLIANLAVNARDAMPRGGRLTLETANVDLDDEWARTHPEVRPGPYVCLSVSDTGCGMDTETLARAFDPFFTTKEPGKGSGLGLPTVYGIVKQSGGSVGIASEPGRGTTVRVYLPRKAGPGESPVSHPRSVAELRGRETVLVVEDQAELRGVIERVLRGLGYRVLAAGSGEDALAASLREPGGIDLLLTDVIMPGMGGPTLVGQLAGTRPRMKVLYISGYSDDAVVKHGILAREARFLAKPFGASALAVAVRKALDEGGPTASRPA